MIFLNDDDRKLFESFEKTALDYIHFLMVEEFEENISLSEMQHRIVGCIEGYNGMLSNLGLDVHLYDDSSRVREHMNLLGISLKYIGEDGDEDEDSYLH